MEGTDDGKENVVVSVDRLGWFAQLSLIYYVLRNAIQQCLKIQPHSIIRTYLFMLTWVQCTFFSPNLGSLYAWVGSAR